jgi:hypothetical protein
VADDELERDELEALAAEPLPDREAMSVLAPPGAEPLPELALPVEPGTVDDGEGWQA